MCSISVEPRPSRISTPKCSVQRWPMSAGSASPADVQRRSPQLAALRQVGAREQRGEQRRHAVEDRRLMLAQPREHGGRRRPLGHQHRRRADRQRKRERRCRGRTRRTAWPPRTRRRPRECRGSASRRARRSRSGSSARARSLWARRSSPTSRARSRRRRRSSPPPRTSSAPRRISFASEWCGPLSSPARAGDDDVLQVRELAEQRREGRQQRRRHDQRARAAVAQHVVVVRAS